MTSVNSNLNEKALWTKVKSEYILRQICDHLNPRKLLEYIRYNKNIQARLNINNNDYLNEYLKIGLEIDLIPVESKCIKFINIGKKDQSNFHFYFDDNPIETKKNYIDKDEKIKKIKIIIDNEVKSLENLFESRSCIKKINFLRFKRKDIYNISNMFSNCSSLEEIDLSHFNTDNVINMSCMFFGCSLIKELNLSNFNTDNVTKIKYMFSECSSIKRLDLFTFNTKKVTNMRGMFCGCSSLEKLDLSNFNTNKVKNMCQMFRKCSSLKELNVSKFNTSEVENMCEMFQDCSSLKELNLSNFNANNLILMNFIFDGCSSLEKLNLSHFDSKNIFIVNCRLGQLSSFGIFTNTVKPIKQILKMCKFSGINMSCFNFNNIIGMSNIFCGCSSLEELNCEDELIKIEYRKFKK